MKRPRLKKRCGCGKLFGAKSKHRKCWRCENPERVIGYVWTGEKQIGLAPPWRIAQLAARAALELPLFGPVDWRMVLALIA